MTLGLALLAWPLTWPRTKLPGLVLWLLPIVWMTRVRQCQQRELEREYQLVPSESPAASAVVASLADLYIWARPAFDLLISGRRHRW